MKIVRKFGDARHGWRGIRTVWSEEWHFKYQVAFASAAFLIAAVVGASIFELVLLFASLCMALGSEVINTAIEDIGNKINPDFDERIGAIKDMAQAFVILSSLPSIAIFLWIFVTRL